MYGGLNAGEATPRAAKASGSLGLILIVFSLRISRRPTDPSSPRSDFLPFISSARNPIRISPFSSSD